jgi:hypothetical protein
MTNKEKLEGIFIEVLDKGHGQKVKAFFQSGKIGNKYLAYASVDTFEELETTPVKDLGITTWRNAKEISPEKITKAQIAEMIGRDINSFEITE